MEIQRYICIVIRLDIYQDSVFNNSTKNFLQNIETCGKANAYAYEFNIDQPTSLRIQYCVEEKTTPNDDLIKEIDALSTAFNEKLKGFIGTRSNAQVDLAKAALSGLLGGIMYAST